MILQIQYRNMIEIKAHNGLCNDNLSAISTGHSEVAKLERQDLSVQLNRSAIVNRTSPEVEAGRTSQKVKSEHEPVSKVKANSNSTNGYHCDVTCVSANLNGNLEEEYSIATEDSCNFNEKDCELHTAEDDGDDW